MPIKFNEVTKHDRLQFPPGVPIGLADKGAEDYFVKAGFAKRTQDKAVLSYDVGSVVVDPATVFADGPKKGQKVLEG
jgi:hypothetical protein